MINKIQRSKNFVPQLLLCLQTHRQYRGKFSDLPTSYQTQPYNLAAKIQQRGKIKVNIMFNRGNDTFVIVRTDNQQPQAA